MACHQAAAKFDFVCDKGHGCAPLSFDDKKIAELQAADPRCPKNKHADTMRKENGTANGGE